MPTFFNGSRVSNCMVHCMTVIKRVLAQLLSHKETLDGQEDSAGKELATRSNNLNFISGTHMEGEVN